MTAMHPDAQRLLDAMRLARRPPLETLTPDQARAVYDAGCTALQRPPEDVAETRDIAIDGPAGPLPARLYRGAGASGVLPGLLFLHGGGWMLGGLNSHDRVCRRLANAAGCWVMALDYRLAPEHPFPAAVEDSAAAFAWLAAHAGEIGIDPARLAVGGDSAGGNLAAVLALMGCYGTLPAPHYQMLLYPATDLRMQSASFACMAEGVPLTTATMRWFAGHYAPDPANWRASPLLAPSLAGTPPAFVLTVGHDPLADEGRAYAARLQADGVRVAALHLGDQIHGIVTMNRLIAAGDMVLDTAAACLRDAWSPAITGRTTPRSPTWPTRPCGP